MEEVNLQKELFQSIMRVNKAMSKRHSALGDLPQGTFVLLHTIIENGKKLDFVENGNQIGMTVSDLSEILKVSRPAISRMINELERKGFIERVSTRSDRRLVYVCIAPLGKEALKHAWERANAGLNGVIDKMGVHDIKELIRILNKLHEVVYELSNDCESIERN
mgnify:CR=1 FL=1